MQTPGVREQIGRKRWRRGRDGEREEGEGEGGERDRERRQVGMGTPGPQFRSIFLASPLR